MADAFEPFHIPQQSRRDKLRVRDLQTLVYDKPYLLSCASHTTTNHHDTSSCLLSCASHTTTSNDVTSSCLLPCAVNNHVTSSCMLTCANNNNQVTPSCLLSCAINNHVTSSYMLSCANPSINTGDFDYAQHDVTGDFVVRKPEPLALSLSSLTRTGTETTPVAYVGEEFDWSVDSVLRGSRFLKPAQELLDEVCDVGFGERFDGGTCGLFMDPRLVDYTNTNTGIDVVRVETKRSRLISLLNEVYKRYKHYYRQIQAVVASFDIVAGAAPFAMLDLKAMSKHFCNLNNAITDQLQVTKEEYKGSYGQSVVNNMDHQLVWRSQRGLPKQAVTVLRGWLFDHFLHPYPTDIDKQMLATQTGLSRNQVSNWFINARVRLWKPMVEEVHTLETRQLPKTDFQEQDTSPLGNSGSSCPPKRAKNDNKYTDHHIMEENTEHMDPYDSFPIYHSSANRGVSLTLGLHQNNNATVFPLSVVGSSQRLVLGGLDAQNREIIEGQFLHEFGG